MYPFKCRISALLILSFTYLVPVSGQPLINIIPNDNRSPRQNILSDNLSLSPIDSSKTDIEIRLYINGYSNKENLVILEYEQNQWMLLHYIITWTDYIYKDDIQVSNIQKIKINHEKYPSLLDTLIFYNLFSLPDMQEIKHKLKKVISENKIVKTVNEMGDTVVHVEYGQYQIVSFVDGVSYFVEAKVGNKIRGYGYSNPELYFKQFPETHELSDFINLLDVCWQLFQPKNE